MAETEKDKLYQYVVILHPTPEQRKKGTRSTVIAGPNAVLAKDEGEVRFLAAREVSEEDAKDSGRLEVAVRPF